MRKDLRNLHYTLDTTDTMNTTDNAATLSPDTRDRLMQAVDSVSQAIKDRGKWLPEDRESLAHIAVDYMEEVGDPDYLSLPMESGPKRERMVRAYVDCWHKRPDKGNGYLYLLRKGRTPDAQHVMAYIRFHSGLSGGSLWGIMGRAGDPFAKAVETMVLVLRHLTGQSSSAALALWKETGVIK